MKAEFFSAHLLQLIKSNVHITALLPPWSQLYKMQFSVQIYAHVQLGVSLTACFHSQSSRYFLNCIAMNCFYQNNLQTVLFPTAWQLITAGLSLLSVAGTSCKALLLVSASPLRETLVCCSVEQWRIWSVHLFFFFFLLWLNIGLNSISIVLKLCEVRNGKSCLDKCKFSHYLLGYMSMESPGEAS